MRDNYKVCT